MKNISIILSKEVMGTLYPLLYGKPVIYRQHKMDKGEDLHCTVWLYQLIYPFLSFPYPTRILTPSLCLFSHFLIPQGYSLALPFSFLTHLPKWDQASKGIPTLDLFRVNKFNGFAARSIIFILSNFTSKHVLCHCNLQYSLREFSLLVFNH